jgi:uncharacterized protein (DUF3820 family)
MAKMNWNKIQQENKFKRERERALNSAPKKEVDPGVRLWLLNGKYFNKPVNDVPDSYLKWIKKNFDNGSYGHKMACNELDIRQCVKNIETRLEEIDKKS